MNKKRKFSTALVATALLSYGFTLERVEEIPPEENELPAEVVIEKENAPAVEPEHLVAKEEILVEVFDENLMEEEGEALPTFPTEPEPEPPKTSPQTTTLAQSKATQESQSPRSPKHKRSLQLENQPSTSQSLTP